MSYLSKTLWVLVFGVALLLGTEANAQGWKNYGTRSGLSYGPGGGLSYGPCGGLSSGPC